MNKLLRGKYPELCAFLKKGVQFRLDNSGLYVQDNDVFLWSDCGKYNSLEVAFKDLSNFLEQYYKQLEDKSTIIIDLVDFIKTHNISAIPNKTSKKKVESILGLPTDYMVCDSYQKSSIWKYGELEVYFDADDRISYCSFKKLDCISYHYPIRKIEFNLHFDYENIPNIFEFHEILNKFGIESKIQVSVDDYYSDCRIICENNVWIYFQGQEVDKIELSVINSVNIGAATIGWIDI